MKMLMNVKSQYIILNKLKAELEEAFPLVEKDEYLTLDQFQELMSEMNFTKNLKPCAQIYQVLEG